MRNLKQHPITKLEKENALEQAISHFTKAHALLLGNITTAALTAVLADLRSGAHEAVDERTWIASEITELELMVGSIPEERVIEKMSLTSRLEAKRGELAALGPDAP